MCPLYVVRRYLPTSGLLLDLVLRCISLFTMRTADTPRLNETTLEWHIVGTLLTTAKAR